MACMSTAMTFSRNAFAGIRRADIDLVRSAFVLACGAALIFAGAPLPL